MRFYFNTHQSDGTPITLAGTPAVSVYKDGSTTESTTGVTLTVDFDARTGMHLVAIDTSSDGTFYAAGSDFKAVITAGTVNSVSVVGTVIGAFSLSARSALRPTTADRTLDVSAASKAPATVAAGDIATDAITAAALAASAVTEIQTGLSTLDAAGVRTAVGLATANLDTQLAAIAGYIDTEVALLLSRLGVPTNASVAADVAAALTAILAKLPAALVSGRMDSSVGAYASGQDPPTLLYASTLVNTTTFRVAFRAMAATLAGQDTKAADGSTSSFADIGDPATTRVTSTNTTTLRTPTIL